MRVLHCLVIAPLVGCGSHHDAVSDGAVDAIDAPLDAYGPNTLFDTGLCVDRACTQISPDVIPYTPQFVLWADTASKRRWYQLPPGTQIDTTDMDHWEFPVGTKFWKEFTRDDGTGNEVRVETRFITRIGSDDTQDSWFYVPYQWNLTNDDTTAVPSGVMNADGTQHDIPSRAQCRSCHENLKPSRILGFEAIELDWANPTAGEDDLATLIGKGTLTANPTGTSPYFPVPGNATEKAALGYLHANCGHCHNPTSAVYSTGIIQELRLTVATLGATTTTPVYTTAVGQPATVNVGGGTLSQTCTSVLNTPAVCIVKQGDPDNSAMIYRFEYLPTGTSIHMPALGSEMIDPTGDAALRAWITALN